MRGAAVEARRSEDPPPVTIEERRVQPGVAAGRGEHVNPGLIGSGHDFRQGRQVRCAAEDLAGDVHGLEHLQAKTDQDPAGGGRSIGQHVCARVPQAQRSAFDDPVTFQVLHRKMPACLPRQPRHRVTEVAAVEMARALARHLPEGVGQVALPQQAPFFDSAVDRPGFAGGSVDGLHDLEDACLQGLYAHPLPRCPGGRLHQASHGQGRQVVVNGLHPCQGSRGRCGPQADVELLGCGTEVGVDRVEVRRRDVPGRSRGLNEEVVNHRRAWGRVCQQETTAADGGQHGFRHAGGELGGDHGVEGVAPFL